MPYLRQEAKDYFEKLLIELNHSSISNPGELNYLFTEIIKQYMENHTKNYQMLNDVVGALDCCKSEFKRRVVDPYEDTKIKLNGDVY